MESETKPKVSKEFYELCYRQYEFEMKETNQLYQKASFVLIVLPLLGVLTYNLGRIDVFHELFTRIDIFLYYLFTFISYICLACSTVYAIQFIIPRKYDSIASMKSWQKLRNDYAKDLKNSDSKSEKLNDTLFQEITEKLAEAQANNKSINEKRRKHYQRCVLMAAVAIIPIGLQSMLYLLLKLQGV